MQNFMVNIMYNLTLNQQQIQKFSLENITKKHANERSLVKNDKEKDIARALHDNEKMCLSTLIVGNKDTIMQIKWNTSCASTLLDNNSNNMSLLLSNMDESMLLWYLEAELQENEQNDAITNNYWTP